MTVVADSMASGFSQLRPVRASVCLGLLAVRAEFVKRTQAMQYVRKMPSLDATQIRASKADQGTAAVGRLLPFASAVSACGETLAVIKYR